jgi:hypothetical protein
VPPLVARVPVTLIVSGLVSVRVPVIADPDTVPLIIPDEEQEPVSVKLAEKAPPVWVNVPETVDEPPLEET